MYEIEKLTENVLVLLAPVNIGFIFDNSSDKVYIVDTGNSEDYARRIIKEAMELNVEIVESLTRMHMKITLAATTSSRKGRNVAYTPHVLKVFS